MVNDWNISDDHKLIMSRMSKKRCVAYLDMCGDCGLDFKPCVEKQNCTKDITPFILEKKKSELRSKLNREREHNHNIFNEQCKRLADETIKLGFKWIPTYADVKHILPYDKYKFKSTRYREELMRLTGLPTKSEYRKSTS